MIHFPKVPVRVALIAAGGAVISIALLACGGGGGGGGDDAPKAVFTNKTDAATATPAPVVVIKISDNKFEPTDVLIKAGTQVRWEWSGTNPHSVLISGSASEQKTGSGNFVRDFRAAGSTFPYQCGVHGAAMAGRITVE